MSMLGRGTMKYRQSGHASTEWAVLTFIMVMVMFAPVTDDGQSIVGMLMAALRDYYSNLSLLLSLP